MHDRIGARRPWKQDAPLYGEACQDTHVSNGYWNRFMTLKPAGQARENVFGSCDMKCKVNPAAPPAEAVEVTYMMGGYTVPGALGADATVTATATATGHSFSDAERESFKTALSRLLKIHTDMIHIVSVKPAESGEGIDVTFDVDVNEEDEGITVELIEEELTELSTVNSGALVKELKATGLSSFTGVKLESPPFKTVPHLEGVKAAEEKKRVARQANPTAEAARVAAADEAAVRLEAAAAHEAAVQARAKALRQQDPTSPGAAQAASPSPPSPPAADTANGPNPLCGLTTSELTLDVEGIHADEFDYDKRMVFRRAIVKIINDESITIDSIQILTVVDSMGAADGTAVTLEVSASTLDGATEAAEAIAAYLQEKGGKMVDFPVGTKTLVLSEPHIPESPSDCTPRKVLKVNLEEQYGEQQEELKEDTETTSQAP